MARGESADTAGTDARSTRWPFAGRVAELATLAAELRRPGCITVLVGPAGIGKTSVALAATAATGDDTVVVRATSGSAGTTLVALVPLLESLGVGAEDRREHPALVTALLRALDDRTTPLLLVVDDAPRLDAMSAAVLHQVLRHHALRTLLTARDGESLPDVLDHLLDEGVATTMAIGPVDRSDSAAALVAALGQPLDDQAITRLHDTSGGNPLILRELVAGTLAVDGFEPSPNGLLLGRPVPSTRLVDLVSRRFERLDPVEREVLELLAVAQPLTVPQLDTIEGAADALLSLERLGLIASHGGGIGLAHPVYDDVVREGLPPLRLDTRRLRAASLLSAQGDPDQVFRATCLLVDADRPVDADVLVDAARRAFGLLDHELAVRLAERAVDAGERFWGNLVLGGASSALGELERAERALDAAASAADDDERRALAAQRLGMHLAVRAERPGDALVAAEAVLGLLEDDVWIRFLAADIAKWRMMAGRPVDDLMTGPLADPAVRSGEPADPASFLNDQMIRALVGVMSGELAAADEAITVGLPVAIAHPEVLPNAQDLLRLSQFLSLTFAAELHRAEALAEAQLALAPAERPDCVGMWSYALAMMDLYRGRAGRAAVRAETAGERLEWRDFTGLRPAARALSATAMAQLGRVGEARATLSELTAESLGDPKVDLLDAQARAWIAVAERDVDAAVEIAAGAGRRAMDLQHPCLGALVSYDVVRLGRAEVVVDDLLRAAAGGTVPLPTLLAEHAVAAVDRDWSALEAVSLRLESVGLTVAAADASAQAAVLHRRAGRSEAARRAARRATAVAEGHDGPRGTGGDEPVVTLTRRELEVAQLACDRLRSREIADRLGISVRTVDNHLASAYRKLGVVNRPELAVAMAEFGWTP